MERGESLAEKGDEPADEILSKSNREQVKDIFQAVIERPAADRENFLNEVCQEDKSLIRQVRELLDSFEEDDSFFERPAINELAGFIVESDELVKVGARLGRYKIQSELGAGGMGRVFLAEDAELERLVALKILLPAFSDHNDGIRRFVREAKSASALNHPNILTIHEIGQFEDLHFIATEYIRGETLRQKQIQKKLNLHEILDIAAQIASALNVAHEAGIIHRDIKPENIMLRTDGLVKVLDFGLAKLGEQDRESHGAAKTLSAQVNTIPGMIMGTVAYMSPEQARGQLTDSRTDIWSLGVCLYEMVAGFKPFTGETNSDTIAAILKSEPPPFETDAPPDLIHIIRKALQKKLDDRYQTVRDLSADLKHLRQKLEIETRTSIPEGRLSDGFYPAAVTGEAAADIATDVNQVDTTLAIKSKPLSRRTAFLVTVAAMILCAAAGLYYFMRGARQHPSFEKLQFEKLTYSGNIAGEQVAVSPDGKYTAYVVQEAGEESLWVRHIETSGAIRIAQSAKIEYGGLSFSRDSNYIYYSMMEKKGSTALYRVPVLGGDARKLIDNVERPVTFSPDGARMAVVQNERSIMVFNSDGSAPRLLATASEGKRWNLTAWSPDGKTIVSTVFSSADNNTYLVEVSAEDGTERPLYSPPWLRVSGIAWLPDGSGLVLSGRGLETRLSQLWLLAYPGGELKRITNDVNNYLGLSLTADGKRMASIQYERVSNVWSVAPTDGWPARQMTFDKDKDEGLSGVAASSGGGIVYTVRMSGNQDLWTIDRDGRKHQLTHNARSNFSPAVSPDNRYIVFVSDRSGSASIWRMNLDGGDPKQLTDAPGIAALPSFSPDGQWVIYQFTDPANKPTVWKVGVEGGAPVPLTDVYSGKPVISPDGDFFACLYNQPGAGSANKIAVIPFSGGRPVRLIDSPQIVKSPNFRWTPDGRGLIYIDNHNRAYNLWKQLFDEDQPIQLTNFQSEEIFRFDAINAGGDIALARGHESSDVIKIDNFE